MRARDLQPPKVGRRKSPDVEDLKQSINRHGQVQPIVARRVKTKNGEAVEVIIGDKRRQAVNPTQQLKVEIIEADDLEAMCLRASEEFSKSDLDPVAKGELFQAVANELQRRGISPTYQEIGRRCGTSLDHVQEHLQIREHLPEAVQERLAQREVGVFTVRPLLGAVSKKTVTSNQAGVLVDKALREGWDSNKGMSKTLEFVEKASPRAKRALLSNPKTTLEEARRIDETDRLSEKFRDPDRGPTYSPDHLFILVRGRLRNLGLYLHGVRDAFEFIPQASRPNLVTELGHIREACDQLIIDLKKKPHEHTNGRSYDEVVDMVQQLDGTFIQATGEVIPA
jgi:ParB/RepB/Spo0J family partition protein